MLGSQDFDFKINKNLYDLIRFLGPPRQGNSQTERMVRYSIAMA
jgi:hypothetical protein